ncbi:MULTISPECIES: hypothetical protein [Oerskovia]|uniref:Uncharacterized protein n=1 Tax=Oerskovia rustica TaxID=2762237 RepID=A0ABR8RNC2_9CELL|nr:hypothetical protein [Oerskovia rustica]MBD7949293.1 hypothetical protein [Oerskovia rustica]
MSTTAHAPARHRDLVRPVLARIRAGDTTDEAAVALGLDPGLVDATVAQLVRLRLVQVAGPPRAGGPCSGSGCPGTPGAPGTPGTPGDAQPTRRLPSACTGCPLAPRSR